MTSIMFFLIFIPILGFILLNLNFFLAPHRPYKEKKTPFECGYHSFTTQNRTPFTVSFYIFAMLFLLFDIEITTVFPFVVSSNFNGPYGFSIVIIFILILTLGFVFELGKNALKIDTKQDKSFLLSIILIKPEKLWNFISIYMKYFISKNNTSVINIFVYIIYYSFNVVAEKKTTPIITILAYLTKMYIISMHMLFSINNLITNLSAFIDNFIINLSIFIVNFFNKNILCFLAFHFLFLISLTYNLVFGTNDPFYYYIFMLANYIVLFELATFIYTYINHIDTKNKIILYIRNNNLIMCIVNIVLVISLLSLFILLVTSSLSLFKILINFIRGINSSDKGDPDYYNGNNNEGPNNNGPTGNNGGNNGPFSDDPDNNQEPEKKKRKARGQPYSDPIMEAKRIRKNEYMKKYRNEDENKERNIQYQEKYNEEHWSEVRAKQKEYRDKRRENEDLKQKDIDYQKQYRESHATAKQEYDKQYRDSEKDNRSISQRIWREANKDHKNAMDRDYAKKPEVKKRKKYLNQIRLSDEQKKQEKLEYDRQYSKRPNVVAKRKVRSQLPEVKFKNAESQRTRRANEKARKQLVVKLKINDKMRAIISK